MYLLQYRLTDGLILSTWTANTSDLLAANIVEDDAVHGYVAYTGTETPFEVQEQLRVTDGAVVPKALVTITPTPPSFAANGIAISTITVSPFVPCTLLVDEDPVALTVGDPALELTASSPHLFVLTLAPQADIWAAPTTAEAV